MAAFTKALSNKWSPNAARSTYDSKDVGHRLNSNRSGDESWEDGGSNEFRVIGLGGIVEPFPLVCGSSDNPIDVQLVDVVEEAQLKGLIPMDASSCTPRAGRLGTNPGSPKLNYPMPAKLTLSIHGIKIIEISGNQSQHSKPVHHRQPLHSILSAVFFHGPKETYIVVAVHPDSIVPFMGSHGGALGGGALGSAPGSAVPGEGFLGTSVPTFADSSCDLVLASCLLFQTHSAADAANFVKDLKDIFVAAMRVKGPTKVT